MTIIHLTTPMSDDKERQRRTKAEIDAIEKYTEERMNDEYGKIHTDGSRPGGQPIPSEDCPKCERFGDDCGEHSPSWQELAAYWKAQAERLRQPTQSDAEIIAENKRLREALKRIQHFSPAHMWRAPDIKVIISAALQEQSK